MMWGSVEEGFAFKTRAREQGGHFLKKMFTNKIQANFFLRKKQFCSFYGFFILFLETLYYVATFGALIPPSKKWE